MGLTFSEKISGASHGIAVAPPTSLAGVDCEPHRSYADFCCAKKRTLCLYSTGVLTRLWFSAMNSLY